MFKALNHKNSTGKHEVKPKINLVYSADLYNGLKYLEVLKLSFFFKTEENRHKVFHNCSQRLSMPAFSVAFFKAMTHRSQSSDAQAAQTPLSNSIIKKQMTPKVCTVTARSENLKAKVFKQLYFGVIKGWT